MVQDAQGWCTGMTQRDGMGREIEGEFRMGNTTKGLTVLSPGALCPQYLYPIPTPYL